MVAMTGIVTGGATVLGLLAFATASHLPAKSIRQEVRARRLSQPETELQNALRKTPSRTPPGTKVSFKGGKST